MSEEKGSVPLQEKALWEKPEMRRLEPRDAEGALTTGNDNTVFS